MKTYRNALSMAFVFALVACKPEPITFHSDGGICADDCRSSVASGEEVCGEPATAHRDALFECACGAHGACVDVCGNEFCASAAVAFPSGGEPGDMCWRCLQTDACAAEYGACVGQ